MQTKYKVLAIDLATKSNFDDYEINDLVGILTECDVNYDQEESESYLTDAQYDSIRAYLQSADPMNTYLFSVGSDIRGGKIPLPVPLGSLDQVYIGGLEEWVTKKGVKDEVITITDKLDGMSGLLIYNSAGDLQIGYSRGDGVEGADLTRHLDKMASVPNHIEMGGAMVRGEFIIKKANFPKAKAKLKSRSKREYKNPRNMVSGQMNSKSIPDDVIVYIDFVAYDVITDGHAKDVQLELLEDNGFLTPNFYMLYGKQLNDSDLADLLNDRRDNSVYELDGVVCDINANKFRKVRPTADKLNPVYAMKYKVADAANYAETKVIEVEWNESKHGYLKPRLKLEPVELMGVTVQHTTGYNAQYIYDNNIGPGTILAISRNGDVVPNPLRVIKATTAQMPNVAYDWNDTNVDIVAVGSTSEEAIIQQVIDFFASVDAPSVREGTVRKMFEYHEYNGFTNAVIKMLGYTEKQWVMVIGKNGQKIYAGLQKVFTNIPLYVLMGSTTFFGRGLGKRKFKKLEIAFGTQRLMEWEFTTADVRSVEGFQDKTILKILDGMDKWHEFYNLLPEYVTIASMETKKDGATLDGQKFCFTGFRDKQLQEQVEAAGGTVGSSVSGNTNYLVAKDPTSNSGKVKAAKDKGVTVISIDEMRGMV